MTRAEARAEIPERYQPGYHDDAGNPVPQPIVGCVVGADGEASARYFEKSSRVRAAAPDLLGQTRYVLPVDLTSSAEHLGLLLKNTHAGCEQIFAIVGDTFSCKEDFRRAGLVWESAAPVSDKFSADRFVKAWVGRMDQIAPLVGPLNLTILI